MAIMLDIVLFEKQRAADLLSNFIPEDEEAKWFLS